MNQSEINFKSSKNNSNFIDSFFSNTKKKKAKKKALNASSVIDQDVIPNGFGEDNTLSKAYKNVINVITNILGKIEEQKINGKTNILNINSNTQRIRENKFLKKNTKKNFNIMESPKSMKLIQKFFKKIEPKERFSLSNISKKSFYSIKSSSNIINNKNLKIPIIKIIKPDKEEKSKQKLLSKNYNKKIDEINNSFHSNTLIRKKFPKFNDLLKINKKRMTRLHSNKIIKEMSNVKNDSFRNIIKDDNNDFSSASILPNSIKNIARKTFTKNDKSLHLKIKENFSNQKSSRRDGSSRSINKTKNIKRATISFSPETKNQIKKN